MYFEEFRKGECLKTRSRVVTPTDIDLFAAVTGAVNPLFLQGEFAQKRGFKGRISPGALNLAINIGLIYSLGIVDQAIAFMSIDRLKFLTSVYPKDTLSAYLEVIGKKKIEKEDRGVVTFRSILENQEGQKVLEAELVFLIKTKKNR